MAQPTSEPPIRAERFRSKNLIVREVRGFSRERLVVTFGSREDDLRPDRPGFGEEFLASRALDAVHVLPRANDWYQHREMPAAAEFVRSIAAGYGRVVAYGSSMGGYAAIRFGRVVGASAALALSPQFSIDPAVVPFERRWIRDSERLSFALEHRWPRDFVQTAYIVFDPHTLDRRHAELFARYCNTVDIGIFHSGHPCAGYLAEVGLLQQAVLALVDGDLDPDWLKREARSRRKQSAHFHVALAMKVRGVATQLALARRATEIAPGNPICLIYYGFLLLRVGERPAAERLFERARVLAPRDQLVRHALAEAYRQAGDADQASALLRESADSAAVRRNVLPNILREWRRRISDRLARRREIGDRPGPKRSPRAGF